MKKNSLIVSLALLLLVMSLSLPAMASGGDDGIYSKSVNGIIVESKDSSMIGKNVFKFEDTSFSLNSKSDIQTMGSFITYGDYIDGTIKSIGDGFSPDMDQSEVYWYHSHQVPEGLVYKYSFEQSLEEKYTKSHTIDAGAQAQGGYKFLSQIEAHINYEYNSEEIVTRTQGEKSGVEVDALSNTSNAGLWEFTWHPVYSNYTITADWEAWTVDDPNNMQIVERWVGSVSEPTDYLHLESKGPQ